MSNRAKFQIEITAAMRDGRTQPPQPLVVFDHIGGGLSAFGRGLEVGDNYVLQLGDAGLEVLISFREAAKK